MKQTNFLKIALTLVMAILVTGAFAQTVDITVYQSDGTQTTTSSIYTINSSDGTVTAIASDDGTGDDVTADDGVVTFTPVANTNYIVANNVAASATQWNTYATPAVLANVTIYLSANYTETLNDYAAGNVADKITINKTLPFWVYPSPVHNPSWVAPAANYAAQGTIESTLTSGFAWTILGGGETDLGSTSNYEQISFSSTGVKTISVQETASAAYGGCVGSTQSFFTEVIDVPYLEFTNAADATPVYTIDGAGINVILSECESVGTTINPTISSTDNTNEEYPWYVRMSYTVHNATLTGNDLTLGAAQTMPAALDVTGDIAASTVSAANPIILDGTVKAFDGSNEYALLAAPTAFTTVGNDITVYCFNMTTTSPQAAPAIPVGGGYNAKISRKSDYVAFRTAEIATPGSTDLNDWTDANFSWYQDDNTAANNLLAFVVILPAPKTGPIYHINNAWGL